MRLREGLRAVLLLALLGTVAIEAVAWLRIPLEAMVHRAYPWVALEAEGHLVYYDHQRVEGQADAFHLLDDRRVVFETRRGRARDRFGLIGARWWSRASLRPFLFDSPRFLMDARVRALGTPAVVSEAGPLAAVARYLNRREAARRGMSAKGTPVDFGVEPRPGGGAAVSANRPPVEWRFEAGRLVCREIDVLSARRSPGRVLAGLGPDGFVVGEEGGGGAGFGEIAGCQPHEVLWWMIEREPQRLVALWIASDERVPPKSVEPLQLSVEMRPLHDLVTPVAETQGLCWIARLEGREHLLLFDDGAVFGRFAVEPGERIVQTQGASRLTEVDGLPADSEYLVFVSPPFPDVVVGVETARSPAAPGTERRRLRLFRPGLPPVLHDVTLKPTRASESLPAHCAAALSLLRPFPLGAISAASGLDENWHDWWWRDAWLADWSYAGWLVASFALAAVCAWRARRSARERCATVRAVRFWTAAVFLLGPVGLLWMRFVLPRVPIEAVGGARRAVNLDTAPSTNAPWPEPKPLGIEVFS